MTNEHNIANKREKLENSQVKTYFQMSGQHPNCKFQIKDKKPAVKPIKLII